MTDDENKQVPETTTTLNCGCVGNYDGCVLLNLL